MHILITGGQGYIGSYLTHSLLEDGQVVSTLDSGINSKKYPLTGYSDQLKRYRGSVINHDLVTRAMHGADVVIHLATRRDWSNEYRQPMKIVNNNVYGITSVLSMARRVGIPRVIFVSSSQVYGNLVPARETDPCVPITMYGASMLASEAICRGFYQMGMEIIILRLGSVWGKFLSDSVVNKIAHDQYKIPGDGDQTRDFIFIDDVVDALKKSVQWDSAIYNIGTGEEVTVNGVWSMIQGDRKPAYFSPNWNDVYRCCLDMEHTSQSTSWKAEVVLSELDGSQIREKCSGI